MNSKVFKVLAVFMVFALTLFSFIPMGAVRAETGEATVTNADVDVDVDVEVDVDAGNGNDEDTTEEDTTEEDATEEDATEEDATEEDATEEDATEEDTTNEDTTEEDSTPEVGNKATKINVHVKGCFSLDVDQQLMLQLAGQDWQQMLSKGNGSLFQLPDDGLYVTDLIEDLKVTDAAGNIVAGVDISVEDLVIGEEGNGTLNVWLDFGECADETDENEDQTGEDNIFTKISVLLNACFATAADVEVSVNGGAWANLTTGDNALAWLLSGETEYNLDELESLSFKVDGVEYDLTAEELAELELNADGMLVVNLECGETGGGDDNGDDTDENLFTQINVLLNACFATASDVEVSVNGGAWTNLTTGDNALAWLLSGETEYDLDELESLSFKVDGVEYDLTAEELAELELNADGMLVINLDCGETGGGDDNGDDTDENLFTQISVLLNACFATAADVEVSVNGGLWTNLTTGDNALAWLLSGETEYNFDELESLSFKVDGVEYDLTAEELAGLALNADGVLVINLECDTTAPGDDNDGSTPGDSDDNDSENGGGTPISDTDNDTIIIDDGTDTTTETPGTVVGGEQDIFNPIEIPWDLDNVAKTFNPIDIPWDLDNVAGEESPSPVVGGETDTYQPPASSNNGVTPVVAGAGDTWTGGNVLPQTGESSALLFYLAGLLLTTFGVYFYRTRKVNN